MNKTTIINFWDRVRSGLVETVGKFGDDELDYVAHENGYSVRQLILHIAREEVGEIQYGLTRELDEFPGPFDDELYLTVKSLLTLLSEVHQDTLDYLEGLIDEDLDRDFVAAWGVTYPLVTFILHVIEHEVHHRGELSLILGLLGREGLDA